MTTQYSYWPALVTIAPTNPSILIQQRVNNLDELVALIVNGPLFDNPERVRQLITQNLGAFIQSLGLRPFYLNMRVEDSGAVYTIIPLNAFINGGDISIDTTSLPTPTPFRTSYWQFINGQLQSGYQTSATTYAPLPPLPPLPPQPSPHSSSQQLWVYESTPHQASITSSAQLPQLPQLPELPRLPY